VRAHELQNRPDIFPGQMAYKAPKLGFSFIRFGFVYTRITRTVSRNCCLGFCVVTWLQFDLFRTPGLHQSSELLIVPRMTYSVSIGTLNTTASYHCVLVYLMFMF